MIALISGDQGLIGKAITHHLWPHVSGYDLPTTAPPPVAEYDTFIDCARYDRMEDQLRTIRTVVDYFKQRGGGRIILFSSIYGHKAPQFGMYPGTEIAPTPAEYAFLKGGVEQLTRYLAEQLKPYSIQVNAIAPGGVMNNHSEEFQDAYREAGGVSMIETRHLLPVVDMLLHPDNRVNGEVITVDGGWCL